MGDIRVAPTVSRIDAALIAYPDYDDSVTPATLTGGTIDLCASPDDNPLNHYRACASDGSRHRQLVINGHLVAQRVYLNRLNETLKNRLNPQPAYPLGREPVLANFDTTRASEIVILNPTHHFITPAASVFDDWIKRPQALFDIPAGL